jgi:hypothetical protein
MKAFGINMNSSPTGKKRNASNMLESPYSKTFIYSPQTKEVEVKDVSFFFFIGINFERTLQETELIELPEASCNLPRPHDLDDLMEDDSHPVSSSDPMLSSPAPSSFSSSSPSSFYSSDETLSPESIDLIV